MNLKLRSTVYTYGIEFCSPKVLLPGYIFNFCMLSQPFKHFCPFQDFLNLHKQEHISTSWTSNKEYTNRQIFGLPNTQMNILVSYITCKKLEETLKHTRCLTRSSSYSWLFRLNSSTEFSTSLTSSSVEYCKNIIHVILD